MDARFAHALIADTAYDTDMVYNDDDDRPDDKFAMAFRSFKGPDHQCWRDWTATMHAEHMCPVRALELKFLTFAKDLNERANKSFSSIIDLMAAWAQEYGDTSGLDCITLRCTKLDDDLLLTHINQALPYNGGRFQQTAEGGQGIS